MFILPPDTPAQVRSWLIDLNQAKARGDGKNINLFKGKIERYLSAVELKGGKILPPPVTQAELDVAYARRNRAIVGSQLEFRSNY